MSLIKGWLAVGIGGYRNVGVHIHQHHFNVMNKEAKKFRAKIEIIGINPFVFVPGKVLNTLFAEAGKHKGKIPVTMKIDGHAFKQTLVKYSGHWRLYLNMPMRKAAGKDVGDTAVFEIVYDAEERKQAMPAKLQEALEKNKAAKEVFESLSPSRRSEIARYIAGLKSEEAVERNVKRAIGFLLGKERFVGRDNQRNR